jgi:hypothetical protein
MNFKNSSATPLFFVVSIAISVFMLTATISITQTAVAQNQSQGQSTGNASLNFYLKLNNNQSTSKAVSQAASNGTGTKNMTITVNVQKGPSGNAIKLPISAVVPNNINPEDLQICASLSSGQQICQPLGQNAANIDLSSSANSTAETTPQSYWNNKANIFDVLFNSIAQYANAQLISVNNTTLNIPITVIIPITIEIQNAQICASVASSGSQTCQQIVLNPTQTAYTPVNVDLSNPTTPTVTTLPSAQPTTQQASGTTGNNATPSAPSSTQQTPAGNVSGSPSSNSSSELPNASPNQPSPSSNPPSTSNDNPSSGSPPNNNPSSSSSSNTPSGSDTGTSPGSSPSGSDAAGSTSSP